MLIINTFSGQVLFTNSLGGAMSTNLHPYLPVFFAFILGLVTAIVILIVAFLFRPKKVSAAKNIPYECGMDPSGESTGRYSVKFYIIAVLFVVFDVETVFLFPWAVKYKALGLFGFMEMFIFLAILVVGLYYAWKKRALEWVS